MVHVVILPHCSWESKSLRMYCVSHTRSIFLELEKFLYSTKYSHDCGTSNFKNSDKKPNFLPTTKSLLYNAKPTIKRITHNMKLDIAHLRPHNTFVTRFCCKPYGKKCWIWGRNESYFYSHRTQHAPPFVCPIVWSWVRKRSAQIECADDGEVFLGGNIITMLILKWLEWFQILRGCDGVVHHDGHCIA